MSTTGIPRTERNPLPMTCSCGREWTAHTALSRAEVAREGRKFTCPSCRKQCLYRAYRDEDHTPTHCFCGNPLNRYATEGVCHSCDEEAQARMDAERAPAVAEAREAERRQVLETLPASLPVIVSASGVRWVDAQRVLRESIHAGDVVQWNAKGFRPLYKLVTDLGDAPKAKAPHPGARRPFRGGGKPRVTDDALVASLDGDTAAEIAERFGYKDPDGVGRRLNGLAIAGRARRERIGMPQGGYRYVWHRVEDES